MRHPYLASLAVGAGAPLLAFAYLVAGPAAAEQTGTPEVTVSFDSRISPHVLPRDRRVPIFLELRGSVRGRAGAPPPRLQRVELAFGARGGLDTTGLPVCPRARLRNATRSQALTRCRGALVGRGEVSTEVPFDPADPMIARVGVLAFNGRSGSLPAVWVHAYSASPPVAFVLPFYLRRQTTGAYGLSMQSPVRSALGRWPRLHSFDITLGRRYRVDSRRRSYLSARCPLPPRFSALSVPVARATYHFAPQLTLIQSNLRRCVVRR
jgi:hypothetical protein